MKLIKAYIRNRKMEEVFNALRSNSYNGMTFVECEGTGHYSDRERGHISEKYPFADSYRIVKLEILIADEQVESVVKLIRKTGRTGYQGDGMIIVSPVNEVYKIRTEEQGLDAI